MNEVEGRSLFSDTYAEARKKFLAAAVARGLSAESRVLNIEGAQGEPLATDVVLDGPEDASKLLVVLSGVHGPEGFCGSAIQTGLLRLGPVRYEDTAVLYVHAINPHGFSYQRRVTQENVDLNRNFLDFSAPLPSNRGYAEIHDALLPPEWPPGAEAQSQLAAFEQQHGARGLQLAITLGQSEFPDGMAYVGNAPTWSNITFRSILKKYAQTARLLASIDIHTGLGPYGVGERIFASFDQSVLPQAERWWGRLTDVHAGSSTSIPMAGPIQAGLLEECPKARQVGICLEYGTVPPDQVWKALRADHWMYRRKGATAQQAREIKREVLSTFYPDADDWKHAIWNQGKEAYLQALDGLQEYSEITA